MSPASDEPILVLAVGEERRPCEAGRDRAEQAGAGGAGGSRAVSGRRGAEQQGEH